MSSVTNLTMNSVNKFGDNDLKAVFDSLDEQTKQDISKYSMDVQISILKKMNDPVLTKFYGSLNEKSKTQLNEFNVRDKYFMLDELYKKRSEKSSKKMNVSKTKIGIIVPFRDTEESKPRTKQLAKLTHFMKTYLSGYDYKIFVIEQTNDKRKFNRGQLLNIGFEIAQKEDIDNFIFHDVDLLPSDDLKEYYINKPTDKPVHIASNWDRYGSNPNYFGGIVAFNEAMYSKINGYPNNFWGWGGEDDELLKRTKQFYDIVKPTKGKIVDLENLNITDKMNYLRENDLKFMQKQEYLAMHDATWKINGLNNLSMNSKIVNRSCGDNCEVYVVELQTDTDNETLHKYMSDEVFTKGVPQELFRPEFEGDVEEFKKSSPAEAFNKLIKMFYDLNLYRMSSKQGNTELEVRFGTKELRDMKKLTKNDYDNIVKILKSFGFTTANPLGMPSLRIRCEYLDSISGRFKMSDVRTEIDGIMGVEKYCKTNDIKAVYKQFGLDSRVSFVNKRPFIRPDDRKFVRPVDVDDFNFRVAISNEEPVKKGVENYIIDNWRKSKKEFRYLNRVTFEHADYPVRIDLSITKTGNKGKDNRGYSHIVPVNNVDESGVFTNQESYDIEIEVNNSLIGPGTKFQTHDKLLVALRKVIKYILSGLQGTMYPISYPEQSTVIRDYMKMIWRDQYDPNKRVFSKNFIGPNSITLQLTNIAPVDENSTIPNIRKDFVVTEKADGDRHLLYISKTGNIYLINTNMDVKFTGAKTTNEECFNLLIDGELISHDKNGEFINLYAAFDIYFFKNVDVRHFTFVATQNEEDVNKCRLQLLNKIKKSLNPVSIVNSSTGKQLVPDKQGKLAITLSPIRFEVKKFYPTSLKQNIFDGCKEILEKEKQHLFEYETDGMIFTHMYYGVGTNMIGKAGPNTKITWENSFKWKPPQYNTVDFLVTTVKVASGEDVVKSIFEDGITTSQYVQYNEYKTVELRCGFNEKYDGYINPCQDIIDDNLPEFKTRFEETQSNEYVPMRFYPTEPYDPNAGITNIMLKLDDSGGKKMFALSGEAITDNTIVEFSYDTAINKEGWNWIPLRVRHDKTAKLRRGEKEYGNAYKVCNENWKSIHPMGRITEDMLMTGMDIPEVSISEDIYYNTPSGKLKTECLKNFHNLYVKKLLINGVSKQGDILIDFACGKAGDLPKWMSAKLSFVFGVDYSKDNIENRIDGACVRYLKSRKLNKHMPYALFVNGNSSFNIRDGSAMINDKAKQITSAVFGTGVKDVDKIGKGVAKQYGKGDTGFNVSSCQFAIHYFFENPDTLKGFLKNVAECTKMNGYFIGTSYDGNVLFNKLKKTTAGESIQIVDDGKKIWEISKNYTASTFEDDSSSIGYKINVYQESINQYIYEYLVNYDYLDRLMNLYGFTLISKEEATDIGLPSGTGLFSELFINMLDEIKKNKYKASFYGEAPNMTYFEKEISFLNRFFVYKKVREVNVDKLNLELSEYNEDVVDREKYETTAKVEPKSTQKVEPKSTQKVEKPKIRKLSKKMILIPATEAIDEPLNLMIDKKKKEKTKRVSKPADVAPKKFIIVESDEENE